MLIDQDNLAGPGNVLPTVHQQIRVIHRLRQNSDGADRRVLLQVQAEYAEFAAWLSQDLGDFRGAQHAMSHALECAHAVGNRDMVTYILARKSQLAGDMGDPLTAVDMADAALHSAAPGSPLRAAGAIYGAYGHALAGSRDACARAVDNAFAQLQDAANSSGWVPPWLDQPYVCVQAGRCHAQLGQHSQAIGAYQGVLDTLPAQYRRDRGVYLARQAVAHAGAGDAEHAATLGTRAVDLAVATGSQRIAAELSRLDAAVSRWARNQHVAGFRAALRVAVPGAA